MILGMGYKVGRLVPLTLGCLAYWLCYVVKDVRSGSVRLSEVLVLSCRILTGVNESQRQRALFDTYVIATMADFGCIAFILALTLSVDRHG